MGFNVEDEDDNESSVVVESTQNSAFNVIVYGLLPSLISFIILNVFFHGRDQITKFEVDL